MLTVGNSSVKFEMDTGVDVIIIRNKVNNWIHWCRSDCLREECKKCQDQGQTPKNTLPLGRWKAIEKKYERQESL